MCIRKYQYSYSFIAILFIKMAFFNYTSLIASPTFIESRKFIYSSDSLSNSFFQDTLLKTTSSDTINAKKNNQDDIYIKLQNGADKNYLTRKLYGLFFRKQNIDAATRIYKKTNSIDKFVEYNGKIINRIDFIRLNAFGQSIYDTTLQSTSLIERSANRIHVKTAKSLIRNTLLFNEGDVLIPVDFAESEQLIRSLDYIEDASIIVEKLIDTTLVNVTVVSKDAWSIGLDYRYGNQYSSQLQLYDKNFVGYGIFFSGNFFYDSRESTLFGRKYELGISNIGGSFIDANIWERLGQGYKSYAFTLKRDFFASKTHYGGGFKYNNSFEPYHFRTIDTAQQISYNGFDYWLGRSFRLSPRNSLSSAYNLVLALRYIDKNYKSRPIVNSNKNYFFHNRKYYLASLSLSKQDLFRANLIYSQGSTEDIPTGFRIQFTTGIEKGEFEDRYYLGNEFSAAEISPWGYLFNSVRIGGFIAYPQQFQQVTSNIRTTFISNLFSFRNIKARQFARIDYTRGISRFYGTGEEGEVIFLDDNNGVRGLMSREMYGTSRLVVNLETVAFSPLYLYGFRFAFYGYYDFGIIGDARETIIGEQFFSGFGLGVRIRNENLVINSISIRLGYYPHLPLNADVTYWLITGQQRTRFEHFRPREPQIVPFE